VSSLVSASCTIAERHRPILLLYQGNPASNITTGVCGISGRITNAPN
jgi:hypothetical protein